MENNRAKTIIFVIIFVIMFGCIIFLINGVAQVISEITGLSYYNVNSCLLFTISLISILLFYFNKSDTLFIAF